MSKELKAYEPYGEEWEKEMMQFPKKTLIRFIKETRTRTAPKEILEVYKYMQQPLGYENHPSNKLEKKLWNAIKTVAERWITNIGKIDA